jgi:hypothetical protein
MPTTPYGCAVCGTQHDHHGRRFDSETGMHSWVRPTERQIKQRMRARRTARLNAEPPTYHARTRYSGTPGDPEDEGYALCADCGTDDCPQYQRIQQRLARSMADPDVQHTANGWGTTPSWPF